MNYSVIVTTAFGIASEKSQRQHPEFRARLARVLKDLTEDPHKPRLRLHPLRGQHAGSHAVSINYQFRIILTLRDTEREVILLDIGSHNEVYRGGMD